MSNGPKKSRIPFGHPVRLIAFALTGAALGLAIGMPETARFPAGLPSWIGFFVALGALLGLVAEAFTRLFLGLAGRLGVPRTCLLYLVPLLLTAKAFADDYFLRGGWAASVSRDIRNAYVFGAAPVLT
jgi:hypothetical protein